MQGRPERLEMATFPTELGWMALIASAAAVRQVVFAHASAASAVAALDEWSVDCAGDVNRWKWLVERLQDFAAGRPVDFRDVPIDTDELAPFQKKVVRHCRAIPYGHTRSYGELAVLAGSPRAARAVGSTMAQNRLGLIVPCHRVINANGTPGSYGGPEGTRTKRKLLDLEQRGLATFGKPRPPRGKAGKQGSKSR
jgi:methylated-DNA-[protein]-cysteine S-methyltransferase